MARVPSSLFAFVVAGALLAAGCSDAADADRQHVAQDVTGAEDDVNGPAESGDAPSANSGSPASPSAAAMRGDPSGATAMTAVPAAVSVTIDGQKLVVDDIVLWSDVSQPGDYDLFLEVHGPDVPAGSEIHVSATKVGTGCDKATNFITLRPESDTPYAPTSTKDPSCGLAIEALPTAAGSRFTGSFAGTLRGIDTTAPETKALRVVFDLVRER